MSPEAPETATFTPGLCQQAAGRFSRDAAGRRLRSPASATGLRAALPLAPAPFLFGLSFGVLADAAGIGA